MLGQREPVVRFGHDAQAVVRVRIRQVGQQDAHRRLTTAADATTKLVQLRQAEPLSAFDEHDGRVGHVDAHLDHGRRDQHVELTIAKRAHDCVLVGRPHATVQQSQLQRSELAGSQPLVFFGRCFGLERL